MRLPDRGLPLGAQPLDRPDVRCPVEDVRAAPGSLPAEREPLCDRRHTIVARGDDVTVNVEEARHGLTVPGRRYPARR